MSDPPETPLAGGGRNAVSRIGDVTHRQTGAWAGTVHALLRHLEAEGFGGAPRVIGDGFDDLGREALSFIEGEFVHPGPWADETALHTLGVMLRDMHYATRTFILPANARWRPWFGRAMSGSDPIIGHCDIAPWNIVAREGQPMALIDWEAAGPVDLLTELAQAAWLNAQLHDDDVAARVHLPSAELRMRQVRAFAEGYQLSASQRAALSAAMIEFAVHCAAAEAIEGKITPDGEGANAAWGVAWRVRSAAWMLKHRGLIERALA